MVFRNGGKTAKKESFYYLGQNPDIDPYYGYEGLILSSRNVWSKAVATLVAQVDKAFTLFCGSLQDALWDVGMGYGIQGP